MNSPWSQSNLSLSQWLLWQEQHRQPLYVLSPPAIAFTFLANVDAKHFRQAFQSVVDRSDALRTVFVEEDGIPQRYVLPRVPQAMDVVDLSAVSQPLLAYEQWHAERDLRPLSPALRPFDSTLVRLGDQHYIWRLALHRLIGDSRSLLLIYRRMAEAYAASAAGVLDALPLLPGLEEYIDQERRRVEDAARLDALAPARRDQLRRSLTVPGERYAVDFGVERTMQLRRAAQDVLPETSFDGSNLFLLCAAALAALVARLRGCRKVTIDTELDQRGRELWTETIGPISRSLSLAIKTAPEDDMGSLLRKVTQEFLRVQDKLQVAPVGTRPAAPCRVLLQIDDLTFGPFGELPAKVERLDGCCSRRKARRERESKLEPALCLWIDSFGNRENLRATFDCCGHPAQGRGPQLAQEFLRLLDALLAAREQPLRIR